MASVDDLKQVVVDIQAKMATVQTELGELNTSVQGVIARVEAIIAALETNPDVDAAVASLRQVSVDLQGVVDALDTTEATLDAERPNPPPPPAP